MALSPQSFVFDLDFVHFIHDLPLAAAEGHFAQKEQRADPLYSQMCWLGQHNADLVLKNIDANTKMIDLGVRQRALKEEMARTAGERDVQRATAEQKAQEAKAQTAELQRVRTVLE